MKELGLLFVGCFSVQALFIVLALIRDGAMYYRTESYLLLGLGVFFFLFGLVINYCVVEIDDEHIILRYPFRIIATYQYPLRTISSINLSVWSLRRSYMLVTFKEGQGPEYFLGRKSEVEHSHMFGKHKRNAIHAALLARGISVFGGN